MDQVEQVQIHPAAILVRAGIKRKDTQVAQTSISGPNLLTAGSSGWVVFRFLAGSAGTARGGLFLSLLAPPNQVHAAPAWPGFAVSAVRKHIVNGGALLSLRAVFM